MTRGRICLSFRCHREYRLKTAPAYAVLEEQNVQSEKNVLSYAFGYPYTGVAPSYPTHHWVVNAIKHAENRAAITHGLFKADGEGSSGGADAQLEPFCERPGRSVNFFAAVPHTYICIHITCTAVRPDALRQPDPSTNPIVSFGARTMEKMKKTTTKHDETF